MAIFEHETSGSVPPGLSDEVLSDALPIESEVDEIMLAAASIEIDIMPAEDEQGQTHLLRREGEDIGAAGVFSRTVPVGAGAELIGVEVELFATNEANYHSAYLALLNSIIQGDPRVSEINGAPGPEMAAVASDLSHHLPIEWICEYSLIGDRNGVGVATYDPALLVQHMSAGGRVEHSFKKRASI